jgi:predicted Zn-dependent protease
MELAGLHSRRLAEERPMNVPRSNFPDARMPGARRQGGIKWWVLVLFALYAGYQFLANREEAAFTGRAQLIDSGIEQDLALGLQGFREVLAQSRVVTAGELPRQVEEITRRLVEAGPRVEQWIAREKGVPARTPWDRFEWQVVVIDSPQANAFCLPGGKMAVYTGIIPVAKTTDALAAVMGHEIAHAVLRHGAERMATQKLVQLGQMAAGLSIGDMDPAQQRMVMAALGAGAQYGMILPFSRNHESEADFVGLMMAAGACFDPREAIGLWQRMGAAGGARPPEFASTHPSGETRIRQLEAWMPEALRLREASGCPPLAR